MKTPINCNIRIFSLLLSVLFLVFAMQGCYDSDNVGDNFKTFDGETVGSYLESKPEIYSEFLKAIEMVEMTTLLKTYNKYTCFAPTNTAMQSYYDSLQISSVLSLPDSVVRYMVYTHFIQDKVFASNDINKGTLPTTNLNSRYLSVDRVARNGTVEIIVDGSSTIVERDIEVENGVIHSINRVITPSIDPLPEFLTRDNRVKLFTRALHETGLDQLLLVARDAAYKPVSNPLSIDNKTICRSPRERKIGFTIFVPSDEVLKNKYNINDYDELVAKAREWYPEGASITDITDRQNSLNRFVGYHIIDKFISYNNFFYKANMRPNAELFEFMETFCPNTIFRVSNEPEGIIINKDTLHNVSGVTILPVSPGFKQDTENGIYYLIDDVLVYDQKVRSLLLNTRIRVDAASLHPELMTNGIRFEKGDAADGVTGAENFYNFPNGYLKNVKFLSANTNLFYLQGQRSNNSWMNYQADEMMATGQFDFEMRLPPVPAGTYEVRFGYTANGNRGIIQFYVDGLPTGIPLNMKMGGTDPRIGWVADGDDGGIETDKMMRNRGYMKGGTAYMMNGERTARESSGALRRIVTTQTWTEDGAHTLRFKSVSEDGGDQFMIDYFELVPKNVYDKSDGTAENRE